MSDLISIIPRLAHQLSSEAMSTADKAMLKRMNLQQSPPIAFYRLAMSHLPEDWSYRADIWKAILQGMAIMSPWIHDPQQPLGKVLAQQGYSESRLERLLSSQSQVQLTLAIRVARFLAAKKTACNWLDIATLLLSQDKENIQFRIAKDYFRYQGE